MGVTYGLSRISCTIVYCMHAPMQCIQNAPAYLITAVSYAHKMFMKLAPVIHVTYFFCVTSVSANS